MQDRPTFPIVLCSGGLEATAGALIAMGFARSDQEWSAIDAAGSLDAPQSIPAGSHRAAESGDQSGHPTWVQRA